MIVCFFDFETNGLLPKENQPTEVGAVKYKYADKKWEKIGEFSEFIHDATYPPQPKKIVELTGITDEMLKAQGKLPRLVFGDLSLFLLDVDIMVAHEANFDKGFLAASLNKLGMPEVQKEWLCMKREFEWPDKYSCHRLTHLALEHFIEFKMRDMHRAVADCGLLQQLMALYDFDEALKYKRSPDIIVGCKTVPPWEDGGAQKAVANKLKMSWERIDNEIVKQKHWVKKVKPFQVDQMKELIKNSGHDIKLITIEE